MGTETWAMKGQFDEIDTLLTDMLGGNLLRTLAETGDPGINFVSFSLPVDREGAGDIVVNLESTEHALGVTYCTSGYGNGRDFSVWFRYQGDTFWHPSDDPAETISQEELLERIADLFGSK